MSPRSREDLERALEGLASARTLLAGGHWATTVSTAYYAMLYATRAALSERDLYSRTHSGTWGPFRKTFVESGEFEAGLASAAHNVQPRREASDYGAELFEEREATEILALAERNVAAVEAMFA